VEGFSSDMKNEVGGGAHLVGLWHAWSHPNKTNKQTETYVKCLDFKFEPIPNPKTNLNNLQ
jgi:hypothetical protein